MEEMVGRVLGTVDATPLEFWVGVAEGEYLELDDVVALERVLPTGELVKIFGTISQVRARHEGARFDSDVFLIEDGVLPAEVMEAAQVTATRVEPEIFVPPRPGQPVRRAHGKERDQALFFDRMDRRFPVGASRSGEPLYANFEFINGQRGAHVNISGVSGVATKTSYATFLLHSLFTSGVLGAAVVNTRALIFNVKGEDLLHLDRRNTSLDEDAERLYRALELPAQPFGSVGLFAPPRPGSDRAVADVSSRSDLTSFFWTLAEFCHEDLMVFLFADAEDERAQYTMVVYNVMAQLRHAEAADGGSVRIEGDTVRTFRDLVDLVTRKVQEEETRNDWAGPHIGAGTVNAFVRRLQGAVRHVERLIRGDIANPDRHRIEVQGHQVTVVDLHNLNDRAKRFVVGVAVRRALEDKEKAGQSDELLFLVLDELNKYAPREGASPIKEVLLDVAERGRSLGCDPDRRPTDGIGGGEADHRQLLDSGGGQARLGRGVPGGVRLSPGRTETARHHPQTRDDAPGPAGDPGPTGPRVPLPGLGYPRLRGGQGTWRVSTARPTPSKTSKSLPGTVPAPTYDRER